MIIKREKYIDNILDFKDKPVIKVLTGLRRSGKSEILNSLIMELEKMNVLSRNIIYINFESLKYENIKNYKSLYEYIKELIKNENEKYYIFLDEIQEVESFEKVIK